MDHLQWANAVQADFRQIQWTDDVHQRCFQLIEMAVQEDLGRSCDWTTVAVVAAGTMGRAQVVTRQAGVVAGLPGAALVLEVMESPAQFNSKMTDGDRIQPGDVLADLEGPARDLLTAERILLNLLSHLSGIATLTARYVDAVKETKARVYDTRKTIPGWRILEKYAVQCGGGRNHRSGLHEAVMLKDNHLALAAAGARTTKPTESQAILDVRRFLAAVESADKPSIIEVEVDSLMQLRAVLDVKPSLVLLDNMSPEQLRKAVAIRDQLAPEVQLEASGGVNLSTIRAIAESGVERISVGALTHSAPCLDIGLDWIPIA